MKDNRIWYAVQREPEDDWGDGSYDYNEALEMLMNDERNTLIAVIENDVCIQEIWKKDL